MAGFYAARSGTIPPLPWTNFAPPLPRIFRSVNCPFGIIGTPTRIGKTMTYAGLFDMTDDMRERLGTVGNLPPNVLAPSAERPGQTAL